MPDDTGGIYPALLRARGFEVEFHEWHEGKAPSEKALASADLMLVLGGVQQVWEHEQHPWLEEEQALIADWVSGKAKPYVGLCLGHQLLASSLDGDVRLADEKEVGLCEVKFADTGTRLSQSKRQVAQWHAAEVTRTPTDAVVLASSPLCPVQAMRLGDHAFSTQFHHEWDSASVAAWPLKWQQDMDTSVDAPGTYAAFAGAMHANKPQLDELSLTLFDAFMQRQGW